MDPLRSLLSIRPEQSAAAAASGADAVIVDMENQSSAPPATQGVVQPLYVKVPAGLEKLPLKSLEIDGIILARIETRDQLQAAEAALAELEQTTDRSAGSIDLIPLMETPTAVSGAEDICNDFSRVKRLAFGGGDYCRALRLRRTRAEHELDIPRKILAEASTRLGLEPPIDTPFPYPDDTEQLRRISERSLALGYQGKICIHLGQVPVVNQVFGGHL